MIGKATLDSSLKEHDILPVTFNVPLIVVLFDNVATQDTFNDDKHVDGLFKLESSLTFNIPLIVVLCDKI